MLLMNDHDDDVLPVHVSNLVELFQCNSMAAACNFSDQEHIEWNLQVFFCCFLLAFLFSNFNK